MLFQPPRKKKNIKNFTVYIKNFRKNKSLNALHYGSFGLKAIESGYILPMQLEAARRIFSKNIKKKLGQIWIRINPNISKTKKPNEMRMGKGKGAVKGWYYVVSPGLVIFEISGLSYFNSLKLLSVASTKLPMKMAIIKSRK